MAFVAVHWALGLLLHQLLELCYETLVTFLLVRFVLKYDIPIVVECDSVVWIRQVLRRKPEIERMLTH
jgi:hypothetical protein